MKLALVVAAAACCAAQESAPIGFLRGNLLAWSGTARTGQITFQTADSRLYSCAYDERTYLERDHQRISIAVTRKGDPVEILTDRRPGSAACYARTIHVTDPPMVVAVRRPNREYYRSPTEVFAPRGDAMTGIVLSVAADSFVLGLRSGEHRTIYFRPDTRLLGAGQPFLAAHLPLNTRVFVRAGMNMDDQLEAYQVVWGEILKTRR